MKRDSIYDIAVAGGGAAGLMSAVYALGLANGISVCVLEKLDRTGKKLLATGNGRCNLTNMNAPGIGYHGDEQLARDVIGRFPPPAIIETFKSLGVLVKEEDEGKVYPMSEQASSVLDALRMALSERGGDEISGFDVHGIEANKDGFQLAAKSGTAVRARKVIFASGGLAAKNLGGGDSGHRALCALGHHVTEMFPALVQLKIDGKLTLPIKGIKYEGRIDLFVDGKFAQGGFGDVLFTEYGLSGPPVLKLSRLAAGALRNEKTAEAHLHVLSMPYKDVLEELFRRRALFDARTIEHFLTGMVNKRIGQTLVKQAGVMPLSRTIGTLSDGELRAIAIALTDHPLKITGTNSFEQAQVTAGGMNTGEFSSETLESRLIPGLYAAGELLDVDGDSGGYNLQWAWASGMLCAQSAVNELRKTGKCD